MDFSNLGQILNYLSNGLTQNGDNINQNNNLSSDKKDLPNKNINIFSCYPNFNLDGSSNLAKNADLNDFSKFNNNNTYKNLDTTNLSNIKTGSQHSSLEQNLNFQNNFEPLLNILNASQNKSSNNDNSLQNPLQNVLGDQNNFLNLISSLAPILSKSNANPLQSIMQGFLNRSNNFKAQKNKKDKTDNNKNPTIESFKNVDDVDFENDL